MGIRLTQQLLLTGYVTDPNARVSGAVLETVKQADPNVRVSGLALEVIRSSVGASAGVHPVQFVICSG